MSRRHPYIDGPKKVVERLRCRYCAYLVKVLKSGNFAAHSEEPYEYIICRGGGLPAKENSVF